MNKLVKHITKKTILLIVLILTIISSNVIVFAAEAPMTITTNRTISANSSYTCTTELYLYVGDTITFNCSYSSSSASVDFGVVTPTNTFRHFNKTNGSISSTMIAIDEGIHKIRIRNNSLVSVRVTGTCSIGWSYMFKSPKLALNVSYPYSQNNGHKGMDITNRTSTSGNTIKGYPTYGTGHGTVLFAGHMGTCGYMVAIEMSNGKVGRYLHLQSNLNVTDNDEISHNTVLAYVSGTGSTQSDNDYPHHLHYDVNSAGTIYGDQINWNNSYNPETFFPQISFTHLG